MAATAPAEGIWPKNAWATNKTATHTPGHAMAFWASLWLVVAAMASAIKPACATNLIHTPALVTYTGRVPMLVWADTVLLTWDGRATTFMVDFTPMEFRRGYGADSLVTPACTKYNLHANSVVEIEGMRLAQTGARALVTLPPHLPTNTSLQLRARAVADGRLWPTPDVLRTARAVWHQSPAAHALPWPTFAGHYTLALCRARVAEPVLDEVYLFNATLVQASPEWRGPVSAHLPSTNNSTSVVSVVLLGIIGSGMLAALLGWAQHQYQR